MSIFDDIGDTLKSIGSGAKDEAESLGSAVTAPLGAAWDLSTFAFTGKSFGQAFKDATFGEGQKMLDPFLNDKTWTGAVTGGAFDAMNFAWSRAASRPLATALTMASHMDAGDGAQTHYSDLFSGAAWGQAYDIAKRSSEGNEFGEAFSYAVTNSKDPFLHQQDGKTPFENVTLKDHPALGPALAFGATIGTSWFLDPTVVAGQVAGVARTQNFLHELGSADRTVGLSEKIGAAPELGLKTFQHDEKLTNRVDGHFNYANGANLTGRKLSGPEIYATSPELQQSTSGMAIAQQMSDAIHIEDPSDALLAYKKVVAVAAGDPNAIKALAVQSAAGRAIADRLENIAKGGPLDLKIQALNDTAQFDPQLFAQYKTQLDNLNAVNGDLDTFASNWSKQLTDKLAFSDRMQDTAGEMRFLPGAHTGIGNRVLGGAHVGDNALRRITEQRLIDKTAKGQDWVMDRLDTLSRKAGPESTLFQKGLYTAPLLLAKPASKVTGVYLKGPKVVLDSLRTVHFSGVVDTHAWGDSLDQFDAMMRLGRVAPDVRSQVLAGASRAVTEGDKLVAAQRVTKAALGGLADHYSAKYGKPIDRDFIDSVVSKFGDKTQASMNALHGSRYAATELSPETLAGNPYYARTMRGVEDAVNQAFSKDGKKLSFTEDPHSQWGVDQIDDNGTLWSVPVLSSQLANKIPLIDINLVDRALSRDSGTLHNHLADLGEAWKMEAQNLDTNFARLKMASGKNVDRINQAITNSQKTLDGLLDYAGKALRVWKFGVLFRLGFPQRVLADDHLRIGAQLHWMTEFAAPNSWEALKDTFYNDAPTWFRKDARRGQALNKWRQDRVDYGLLKQTPGATMAKSDIKKVEDATRVLMRRKANAEEVAGARAVIDRLDPDGYVHEWFARQKQIESLGRSISGHQLAAHNAQNLIDAGETEHIPRLAKAREGIAAKQAQRQSLIDQHDVESSPYDTAAEARKIADRIKGGWKSYVDPKTRLGQRDVKVRVSGSKNYLTAEGLYAADGGNALRARAGSSDTFDQTFLGPDSNYSGKLRVGKYDTVSPESDDHLAIWADVLNHQIRNAPEAMVQVRNPDMTADEFRSFLADHPDLKKRVRHFAVDPDDWHGRIRDMMADYVPSQELRDLLVDGRMIHPDDLEKLFPVKSARPVIHGQTVNANTSRGLVPRFFSAAYEKSYKALGEIPTDLLSRHPLFNTMYKKELTQLAASAKADKELRGLGEFTNDDLAQWTALARKKALGHVERTLWHVSAHSQAANTMRFLSPFFAAHQEAISRWWRIAQENPDVIRKFQLGFDNVRRTGLVYDTQTQEPVKPGDPISSNHNILIQIPFVGDGAGVNKWLKKMGGGRFWSVRESGLNIILQNGLTNPGTGPLVTVPLDALARHYASDPEVAKVAALLDPYPQTSVMNSLLPSGFRKGAAVIAGEKGDTNNYMFAQRWNQNAAELITDYRRKHDGQDPTDLGAIMEQASKRALKDMKLATLSSFLGFTPAAPESKYSLVQQGWQRIQNQGNAQGKDYEWMRDQFNQKYGEIYDALISSTSLNPARLSGTPSEVGAVQRYKSLIGQLSDPKLARMIIGPAAAMTANHAPGAGQYTSIAKQWLASTNVAPGSSTKFFDQKDPKEIAYQSIVQSGWDDYDKNMLKIQVAADTYGLSMTSATVRGMKALAVQQITQGNQLWGAEYASREGGISDSYDKWLIDMHKIASAKVLTGDTERQDVQTLQSYLDLRDSLTGFLAQRKAAGQPYTPDSQANAPLMQAFASKVQQLAAQSSYFKDYMYNGLIEFDPYIIAGGQ